MIKIIKDVTIIIIIIVIFLIDLIKEDLASKLISGYT